MKILGNNVCSSGGTSTFEHLSGNQWVYQPTVTNPMPTQWTNYDEDYYYRKPWYPKPWDWPWDRRRPLDPPYVPPCPPCPPVQPSITIVSPPMKPRAPINRKKPRAPVNRQGNKETYIALILDKSQSMTNSYQAALNAINEQIDVIRRNAEKGGKTFVSLLTFSDNVDVIYENVPAYQVRHLEPADYVLENCTALRDAIMTAIDIMVERQRHGSNQGFLSVLISDGQENQSGTTREQLQARISELERTDKWTFTYMLDGHSWKDLNDVSYYSAGSMNNFMTYNSSAHGTAFASAKLGDKLGSYMACRAAGVQSTKSFMGVDGADVLNNGGFTTTTIPNQTTVTPTTDNS